MGSAFWRISAVSLLVALAPGMARPLLVISIDGLDHRYLRDASSLGLKIPNIRRLMSEGQWAEGGVVGVMPTVTFPSHTTIVTGVRPDEHGIINNNQPADKGGERYWSVDLLKAPVLWDAAKAAGLKVGAVHWPVTVDAKIDWNFPEYFQRRRPGGGMDWDSAALKSTPGLVDRMVARFPSMPQEFVDDRVRTLATLYLLKYEKPDLVLLHLVDHDAAAHETGPFSKHANAIVEYQDELLGQMMAAMPRDMALVLLSDHGFERGDEAVNVAAMLKQQGIAGTAQNRGLMLTTEDAAVAAYLRTKPDIAVEIPRSEWPRFLPSKPPLAAFQPAPNLVFATRADAPLRAKAEGEVGHHGYWPLRKDYRSSYVAWGRGIRKERLGEIDMLTIADRLSGILGISFGKGK